jgi:hypothetical protein
MKTNVTRVCGLAALLVLVALAAVAAVPAAATPSDASLTSAKQKRHVSKQKHQKAAKSKDKKAQKDRKKSKDKSKDKSKRKGTERKRGDNLISRDQLAKRGNGKHLLHTHGKGHKSHIHTKGGAISSMSVTTPKGKTASMKPQKGKGGNKKVSLVSLEAEPVAAAQGFVTFVFEEDGFRLLITFPVDFIADDLLKSLGLDKGGDGGDDDDDDDDDDVV